AESRSPRCVPRPPRRPLAPTGRDLRPSHPAQCSPYACTMTVFDEVRSNCASFASGARFVHINTDRLRDYALGLPVEDAALRSPELDPATHYLGGPDTTLAYVVSLDAINFGSG